MTAGASLCRIPSKLVANVSGAVATAGVSRLTVVISVVSLVVVVGWIVVVYEFGKFGSKFCAWPEPNVGHATHVGSALSTWPVVSCLSSLAGWCVELVVVQLSEMDFFEVRQQG